jgi:hypothetical protein
MARTDQYSGNLQMHPETFVASSSSILSKSTKSAARTDIAVLACTLFIQRFSFPFFGEKTLSLGFVLSTLILIYQFTCGGLLIQYDRLLWFLAVVAAATFSVLVNFNSTAFTSYGLFVVVYFLFTLSRPYAPDQYKRMLDSFQFLMLIISSIAIAQFPAQFVVDGKKLIMFYGIFPESILPLPMIFNPGYNSPNTIGIVTVAGHSLIKSNGIFLGEPSQMSQLAALSILIEVMEFRRPRYLIVFTLGLLFAYSGTGISILLLSLPLATLVNRRAQLPALLVGLLGFGLLETGIIHLSAFTSRVGEFENTQASGFIRFVSPFWLAADYFNTATLSEFLFGNGPGGPGFTARVSYSAGGGTWFKLLYEYGLVTAFLFTCFCGSWFRRSRCPTPLIVALIYYYVILGNSLDTSLLMIMIVFCTLNSPEPRHGRINEPGRYRSSQTTGPVMG